jgi:CoA:oxalate CoA-transferase
MSVTEAYLEGVRVLDFTQYLAGPACTRLLAEMGADVIKVEMAPFGEPTRATHPRKNRRGSYFVQQTRGKRSLCLDLRRPEAIAAIKDLLPQIDVVVENFSAGVMARKGLGYDELAAINPRIIMASVSGFGQTGPLAGKTAFDFIAQAYTGIMHMTGDPDGPPSMVGVGVSDVATGVHAWAGIGYALYRRDRTGHGCHIDVSLVDSMYHMQEMGVHAPSIDPEWVPMRNGRHYQPSSPAGAFQGPEGWIVVFCTQNQTQQLWDAMGRPDLAEDPRFATNDGRVVHRDALTAEIEAWMAGFERDGDVLAVLEEHRVPCAPVLRPDQLGDAHPHFRERGTVRTVSDPLVGEVTIPGFPIRFSDAPPLPDLVAPNLGQHNHAVLAELAGYDAARIASLEASGVLVGKDR